MAACPSSMLCWSTPTISPPTTLMPRMDARHPSPRTNLEHRPSPRRSRPPGRSARRFLASFVDQAGVEVGVDAICLPGMASRVKRAPTSAIRPRPW